MSLGNTDAPSNFEALSSISDKLQIHPFYRGSHTNLKCKFLFSKYAKNFFWRKTDQTFDNGGKSVLRQSGFFPT